ncbi:hypothetical protein B5D82_19590 [Cognaticolwellia beringensis]|uniref:Uncharacterized protein n=1 Tax=Cognaticolwellia beringensis TaxID=1967665 RepID=A0A222GDA9_9GAMM|nr:hypothetical protein B5D82_19590 [Cognaticolwellia beringensis]
MFIGSHVNLGKRRNGFYIGAAVGFLGYLIQETTGSNPNALAITDLLFESFLFAIVSGVLFLLGFSALAGRGHADSINSQKYDDEISHKVNKEVATKTINQGKHK